MKLSAIIPYQLFILGLVIVSHYTTATVNSGPWICQPLYHSNCFFLTMNLSAIISQQLFILDHGIVSHYPTATGNSGPWNYQPPPTATVYYVPWFCQPLSYSNCLFWTMDLSATTPQELVIALWKGKQGWRLVQRAVCQGPKKWEQQLGLNHSVVCGKMILTKTMKIII